MGVVQDLKQFITHGNAVDMAVGIVIGTAFTAVITALVNGILLPLVSVPGAFDFSGVQRQVGGGVFKFGLVLTAVISFLLIAVTVFFAVVRPLAMLEERRKARLPAAGSTTKECPECLSQIPIKARRCMYCTSVVA
jgi:large conductance mechanosensitive channel